MVLSDYKCDVIVIAGQSNAEGTGRGPVEVEYQPTEKILSLSPEFLWQDTPKGVVVTYYDKPYSFGVAEVRKDENGPIGDFSLTFAEEYVKGGYLKEGRHVLIVRAAIGGTGFESKHWDYGNAQLLKMHEMINHVLSANEENRLVAFLWHQGETDACWNNDPKRYFGQLVDLFTGVRFAYDSLCLPVITGEFVQQWIDKNRAICEPILAEIRRASECIPYAAYVTTENLPSNDEILGNGDDIHFSRQSLIELGKRYFAAWKYITEEYQPNADFADTAWDVIVEAGQSNAEGCGAGPSEEHYAPNPDIYYFNALKSVTVGDNGLIIQYFDQPYHVEAAAERYSRFNQRVGDFALTFAEEYVKGGYLKNGRKVLIVRAAIGGTGLFGKHWGMEDPVYLKMREMIDYILAQNPENRIVGMLWHQGEHDAYEGNTPENFYGKLSQLLKSVREAYGGDFPFIAAEFVRDWMLLDENRAPCRLVLNEIRRLCEAEPRCAFVDSEGLCSNRQKHGAEDNIHFCLESLQKLGRRYFAAWKTLYKQ
ncbi:MAG: hypothetical protein IJF71_06350 [Clostridia bacterium]|nr:hypothetical protein [Clostridia bacterium]